MNTPDGLNIRNMNSSRARVIGISAESQHPVSYRALSVRIHEGQPTRKANTGSAEETRRQRDVTVSAKSNEKSNLRRNWKL